MCLLLDQQLRSLRVFRLLNSQTLHFPRSMKNHVTCPLDPTIEDHFRILSRAHGFTWHIPWFDESKSLQEFGSLMLRLFGLREFQLLCTRFSQSAFTRNIRSADNCLSADRRPSTLRLFTLWEFQVSTLPPPELMTSDGSDPFRVIWHLRFTLDDLTAQISFSWSNGWDSTSSLRLFILRKYQPSNFDQSPYVHKG